MKDRFYVGMRVRRTNKDRLGPQREGWRDDELPDMSVGERGTVMCRERDCWLVLFDVTKSPHVSGQFAAEPRQIEPIYDGDEKTAWSESAWKPMHLRQDEMTALNKRGFLVTLPDRIESK